jgi:hypothetical protein
MNIYRSYSFVMVRRRLRALLICAFVVLLTCHARATPSQQDVFKSIQDNVGESKTDSSKLLIFMCGGAGFLIILAIFNQREKRVTSPKPLHHAGKLTKEVLKGLPLRPKELKQLTLLANLTPGPDGQPLSSPVTLMLCPSLLAKAIQNKSSKVDRRILAAVYQRLGQRTNPGPAKRK